MQVGTNKSLELWHRHPIAARLRSDTPALPSCLFLLQAQYPGETEAQRGDRMLKVSSQQEELASGGGNPQTLHLAHECSQ